MFEDLRLDGGAGFGMFEEILLGIFPPLADALTIIGEPGAALVDDVALGTEIDNITDPGNSQAVGDIELRLFEGGGDLVLDHLHPGAAADDILASLDRCDLADIHAHRGVELQGVAAGRRLGIAEHHPDLHANLVDKDDAAVRLADRPGQLAQRLGHQPRLQAHMRIAHLPFDLGFRHQRCHRIDHQDIEGIAAHEDIDDLQGLFAGIGLRDEEVVGLHPELVGIGDIQGMLGVDEGGNAAGLLGFGNNVQRQGRLARTIPGRRFR